MKIVIEKNLNFLHQTRWGSLLFIFFIFFTTVNLAAQNGRAQDGESVRINKLEGKDFSLTLHGVQTVVTPELLRGEVFYLERSATIHTSAGTFLEILHIPSGTIIKLAENTSFIYNGVDETGKFVDVALLYGRILVVSGYSPGSGAIRSLVVRSGGVSTRIENADIGIDYLLEPGGGNSSLRPLCHVHAFRGRAEIFPYGRGSTPAYFGGAESLALGTMESLSLDISSSYTFTEKTSLGREYFDYWKLPYFNNSQLLSAPNTALVQVLPETPDSAVPQSASAPQVIRETEKIYIPVDPIGGEKRYSVVNNRSKNVCLAIGFALTLGSAAAQSIFHYRYDNYGEKKDRDMFYIASSGLGTGLIITLTGIMYNPSSTGK